MSKAPNRIGFNKNGLQWKQTMIMMISFGRRRRPEHVYDHGHDDDNDDNVDSLGGWICTSAWLSTACSVSAG